MLFPAVQFLTLIPDLRVMEICRIRIPRIIFSYAKDHVWHIHSTIMLDNHIYEGHTVAERNMLCLVLKDLD